MLGHLDLWTQALRAKFLGIGKPWGRTELDTVTKDFDVSVSMRNASQPTDILNMLIRYHHQCVLDVPCPFFVEEFIDAYPDAKVVLNKRDVDKWLTSMNNTLFTVFQWPSWKILRYTDPGLCGAWYTHVMLTWEIFCGHDHGEICRQRFLQHYEHVRSVVPKDRLLEYDLGAGWEPLCKFLEVPQPKEDFPNMNKKEDFFAIHGQYWKYSVYLSVKNVAKVAVPVLATAIGAFYYARKA